MLILLPILEASTFRVLMRRSDSSRNAELRAMKEECDEFWWDREDRFVVRLRLFTQTCIRKISMFAVVAQK